MGQPSKLRLVELGPGRGTFMADLLRGTSSFAEFSKALEVELVEISPALRRVQWAALRCAPAASSSARSSGSDGGGISGESGDVTVGSGGSGSRGVVGGAEGKDAGGGGEMVGVSRVGGAGAMVRWRAALDEVPVEGPPAIYLAHEFFDALPVHQFVRDKGGRWVLTQLMVVSVGQGCQPLG